MSEQVRLRRGARAITKRDLALVVTVLSSIGAIVRFAEKKIEASEIEAKSYAEVEIRSVRSEIGVERDQRREDLRQINGKLDNITKILIDMRGR